MSDPGSTDAGERCYTELNVQGEGFGNCGYNSANYIACETEHAQCGQLQCDGGTYMRGEVQNSVFIYTRFTSLRERCMSFSPEPGTDTPNPGLVTDGTTCGNASVCDA